MLDWFLLFSQSLSCSQYWKCLCVWLVQYEILQKSATSYLSSYGAGCIHLEPRSLKRQHIANPSLVHSLSEVVCLICICAISMHSLTSSCKTRFHQLGSIPIFTITNNIKTIDRFLWRANGGSEILILSDWLPEKTRHSCSVAFPMACIANSCVSVSIPSGSNRLSRILFARA